MSALQLRDLLNGPVPVVQAPMAGVSTPELAAAVGQAGGLGSLGVGTSSAAAVAELVSRSATLSNKPVNLNFFAHPAPTRDRAVEQAWLAALAPLFEEIGATAPATLAEPYPTFDANPDLLAVLLDHRCAVVSFHFGLPAAASLAALRARGTLLLATATTVAEALFLERAGIDVIVAQGWEAGGHRGNFLAAHDAQLTTLALVPQVVRAVGVPVLAAGGISDGRSVAAVQAIGAAGAQVGTAFIGCPESSANNAYRNALRTADACTAMTAGISGRAARGLRNALVEHLAGLDAQVPQYPLAYAAGKALLAAAQAAQRPEFEVMWAGQGVTATTALPAAELLRQFAHDYSQAMDAGTLRA